MTTGNSQESGTPDITVLGDDVFQIDTKMAGYPGITAGYLIRSSRPCLVETGTSTSARLLVGGRGLDGLVVVLVVVLGLDFVFERLIPFQGVEFVRIVV